MALAIKRAPVLRGKAARDFRKKLEAAEKTYPLISQEEKDEREKGIREMREYLSKQKLYR